MTMAIQPSKTLSALQNIGSKIYRTDTNGNIVITTDGLTYSITTQKPSGNTASTISQTKNFCLYSYRYAGIRPNYNAVLHSLGRAFCWLFQV